MSFILIMDACSLMELLESFFFSKIKILVEFHKFLLILLITLLVVILV